MKSVMSLQGIGVRGRASSGLAIFPFCSQINLPRSIEASLLAGEAEGVRARRPALS